MKINYYLDWYENGFTEKLARLLREDIPHRKSLAFISAQPSEYWDIEVGVNDVPEKLWFNKADMHFDEYYLIDHRTSKDDAQKLIKEVGVIFLCGGSPHAQKRTLVECCLLDFIKNNDSVVIGTSAGAMNMSTKWMWSKHHDLKSKPDVSIIYDGINLNHLSFEPHFNINNVALIEEDIFPLSEELNIYASVKDGAMRIKDGKVDIIGEMYLISNSKIHKLDETL